MEKNKKYTYTDYLELKRAGYRGVEIIEAIPYQYGVRFDEQTPVRFTPDIIEKILLNFSAQFEKSLKETPYQVFLNKDICLNDTAITPDLIVMNEYESIALIAEIPESEKHNRLQQYDEAGIEYWLLYPDSQCIGVYGKSGHGVYANGDCIPIGTTGCTFHVDAVWEPPI